MKFTRETMNITVSTRPYNRDGAGGVFTGTLTRWPSENLGIAAISSLADRIPSSPALTKGARVKSTQSCSSARSPASALRKELLGVDGAVVVVIHVILEDDPTLGVPAVTEPRGGLVHVTAQDDSIVELGARAANLLTSIPGDTCCDP